MKRNKSKISCKQGFTLIELLVVVLIIGILAAIAVPQYQKAVYKSRATEAVTMLKSLVDAQEIYYLANGQYTNDITKLDLEVLAELKDTFSGGGIFENKYSYNCGRATECIAKANNDNMPSFQFNFTRIDDVDAGKFYCSSNGKNNLAKSICESMGHVDETRTQAWAAGKYFILN